MLTDSITSYILNFTPDGCMVGKEKNVTDKIYDNGGVKIIAIINFFVQPLVENMKEFAENKKYF